MASFVRRWRIWNPAIFPASHAGHREKESFKRAEKELDGFERSPMQAFELDGAGISANAPAIYDRQFFSTSVATCKFSICRASASSAHAADALRHADGAALGRELAARGLVIVSGLARGIDAIGTKGLGCEWRAIGVLGRALMLLPEGKQKLYEKFSNAEPSSRNSLCGLIPHRRIFRA